MGIAEIATAAVALLAPYLPYLVSAAKGAAEAIGKKGGEAAWTKAQEIWTKITSPAADSPALQGAAAVLASNPEDSTYQTTLAKVLAARLESDPNLARELAQLLGGPDAIQTVLIKQGSLGQRIMQTLTGDAKQSVEISDRSVGTDITQTKQ
jgi:hypothetical protein